MVVSPQAIKGPEFGAVWLRLPDRTLIRGVRAGYGGKVASAPDKVSDVQSQRPSGTWEASE
jgi:hypothetical protein